MKFKVSRTSNMDGSIKPCAGTFLEPFTRIDERTTNDPKKIPAFKNSNGEEWYRDGRNHRVEKGRIKRDFDDAGWFIEIKSLEDLVKFYRVHGEIIIRSCWRNPSIIEIEIYDDYRE